MASETTHFLYGTILPIGSFVRIGKPIPIELKEGKKYLKINTEFYGDTTHSIVKTNAGEIDVYTMRNTVEESINSILSISNFYSSNIFYVFIRGIFSTENNITTSFRRDIWAISENSTNERYTGEIPLSHLGDYNLTNAYSNYTYAMRELRDSAFFARRAYEALVRRLGYPLTTTMHSSFTNELNISPEIGKYLSEESKDIRHGGISFIDDRQRLKILKNIRAVILRYIQVYLENKQPSDRLEII